MKLPVETNVYSITIMKNILMKKDFFFFFLVHLQREQWTEASHADTNLHLTLKRE